MVKELEADVARARVRHGRHRQDAARAWSTPHRSLRRSRHLVNNAGVHLQHAQLPSRAMPVRDGATYSTSNIIGALICTVACAIDEGARRRFVINQSSMAAYGGGGAQRVEARAQRAPVRSGDGPRGRRDPVNGIAPDWSTRAAVEWMNHPTARGSRTRSSAARRSSDPGRWRTSPTWRLFLCSDEAAS